MSDQKPIRTFNIQKTQFHQNPPQFQRVQQFTDANTIAIAWELGWSQPEKVEKLLASQKDPDHHLMHYHVRRVTVDGLEGSDRELTYTVKPCQVLHREPGGLLKSLLPRFKVVDHFNHETLEDQAALPVTGRTYRYEVTPVDFAGNPSPNPLVLFATRYPNLPPQVPTDGELIIPYILSQEQEPKPIIGGKLPELLEVGKDNNLFLEWTDPKPY